MTSPFVMAALIVFLHISDATPPNVADLVGDWNGTSLCQVKSSACHDEEVVYRMSKPHDDKITIQADKIVEGKPITMGASEWAYDKSTGTLTWQIPRGTWKLAVNGDTMDGTLIVSENVLFRKIHLKKSK